MSRRDTSWATRDLERPGYDLPEPGAIRWRYHRSGALNPVEDDVAEAFAAILNMPGPGGRRLTWWHTPNEGTRTVRTVGGRRFSLEAQRQARQGVKAGVPDVLIFTPPRASEPGIGVAIELKRCRTSSVSEEQLERLRELRDVGWLVFVCPGFDDALDALRVCGWLS